MFEVAELGQSVDKKEYEARVPELRTELVRVQHQLKAADFSVVIVLEGIEGAGKSETLQLMHGWLDARFLSTWACDKPTDEERERPYFWRFWRALPPRGRIAFFLDSWYTRTIRRGLKDKLDDADVELDLRHINALEQALAANGTLLMKFWFHLSRDAQKKRLRKLKKDAATRWRASPLDWKLVKFYDEYRNVAETALRLTSSADTPWTLLDCTDERHRNLTVGTEIARAIRERLGQKKEQTVSPTRSMSLPATNGQRVSILDRLDLSQRLDKAEYERDLEKYLARLRVLTRKAAQKGISSVLVFEGWDASGKGGVVRRLMAALDPRDYQVVPVGPPTDEEKAHHYLWRFWRRLPRSGKVTVFDRSWYGRVLVERVEGLASEAEWRRAYKEINDFEQHLAEHGALVMKFWLHIDKDEQLRRFKNREATPYKEFKISAEDWRNREKWDLYDVAVNEMVERCSTNFAPWTLVEANDKYFARVKVLKHVCRKLQERV